MMRELKGILQKVLYRNKKTGRTTALLEVDLTDETIPTSAIQKGFIYCVGNMVDYNAGQPLLLTGRFSMENGKYMTFQFQHCIEYCDNEIYATRYFETLGFCTSVANECAKTFMPEIFRSLQDNAEKKLASIKGVSEVMAIQTARKLLIMRTLREIYEFLGKREVDYNAAESIFNELGTNALQSLRENPYIARDYGISFYACDWLAYELGFDMKDDRRIRALVDEGISKVEAAGHTYFDFLTLQKAIKSVKKCFGDFDSLLSEYHARHSTKRVIKGHCNGYMYSKLLENAEWTVAREIKRLQSSAKELNFSWAIVDQIAKETGKKYARQQRTAFALAKDTAPKVFTGGPGTGKTTTIQGILMCCERIMPGCRIKLAAPTGRAAQRMKEQTGRDATTIHRLLGYRPYGKTGEVHLDRLNQIEADVLVIDEFSMADIILVSILLKAVPNGTLVVFVGDVNQLASIGPGNVLKDMINSLSIPVFALTECFRQALDSSIVSNALKINQGNTDLKKADDFKIISCKSSEEAMKLCLQYEREYFKPEDPYYVQILCPTNEGACGVRLLNDESQKMLNNVKECYIYGNQKFNLKDKIIMTENNYSAGYCNGDIGQVIKILPNGVRVDLNGEELDIPGELMQHMKKSYAITIHKGQGSEFPVVIIVLTKDAVGMLKKSLLYTGVTRSKVATIVISVEDALERCIKDTSKDESRNTELAYKLQQLCG